MFQPKKNRPLTKSIAQLKETYQDHPCMVRLNVWKEELKQEKLRDRTFYKSLELSKTPCQ